MPPLAKIIHVDPSRKKTHMKPALWELARPAVESLNSSLVPREEICQALSEVFGCTLNVQQLEYHAKKWDLTLYDARNGLHTNESIDHALADDRALLTLRSLASPDQDPSMVSQMVIQGPHDIGTLESNAPTNDIDWILIEPGLVLGTSDDAEEMMVHEVVGRSSVQNLVPKVQQTATVTVVSTCDQLLPSLTHEAQDKHTWRVTPQSLDCQQAYTLETPQKANFFYYDLLKKSRTHHFYSDLLNYKSRTAWCQGLAEESCSSSIPWEGHQFQFALALIPEVNYATFETVYQAWQIATGASMRIHLAVCCTNLSVTNQQMDQARSAIEEALRTLPLLEADEHKIWYPYISAGISKLRRMSCAESATSLDHMSSDCLFYGPFIPIAWLGIQTAQEADAICEHFRHCGVFRNGLRMFVKESHKMILGQFIELSSFLRVGHDHLDRVLPGVFVRIVILVFLTIEWTRRCESGWIAPAASCDSSSFCCVPTKILWAAVPAAANVLGPLFEILSADKVVYFMGDPITIAQEILDMHPVEALVTDEAMVFFCLRLFTSFKSYRMIRDEGDFMSRTAFSTVIQLAMLRVSKTEDARMAPRIMETKDTSRLGTRNIPQTQHSARMQNLASALLGALAPSQTAVAPESVAIRDPLRFPVPKRWSGRLMSSEDASKQDSLNNASRKSSLRTLEPQSRTQALRRENECPSTQNSIVLGSGMSNSTNWNFSGALSLMTPPFLTSSSDSGRSFRWFADRVNRARDSIISLRGQKSGLSGVSSIFSRESNTFSVVTGYPSEPVGDDPMELD